jgi:proteic killer suppression protein
LDVKEEETLRACPRWTLVLSFQRGILVRLDAIDKAASLAALNQPSFDFHPLRGPVPRRYSIHINGPWCITFEWREGQALRVDLEQYH